VAKPLLHLGDVRLVGKRVRRRCPPAWNAHRHRPPQRDDRQLGILHDDVAVDGTRIEVLVERPRAVIRNGPEEGRVQAFMAHRPAVLPRFQILPDKPQRHRVNGDKPYLVTLAPDAKVHDALAALQIAQRQQAQLLTANT